MASCIFFFWLGKFSSILLKVFSGPFSWDSSSSSLTLRFSTYKHIDFLDILFQEFLDLTYPFTDISISSIESSTPESFSSISCTLLVKLSTVVPVQIHNFFISRIPLVCILLYVHFYALDSLIHFLQLVVCIFLDFRGLFSQIFLFCFCSGFH